MSCASDIPETFTSPTRMARTLSSYIACPRRVQDIVHEHFSRRPEAATIRAMREKYLRGLVKDETVVDSRWNAFAESEKLAATNERFVAALQREREGVGG